MEKILNYIGGNLVEPASNAWLDDTDPATGKVYAQVPDSNEADLAAAVEAANKAFPAWSALQAEERAAYLFKLADLLEENMEEFARAESIDNGKPVDIARSGDIPRSAANVRFYAAGVTHFASESHTMGDIAINYTLRDPLGIVGTISPWNFPLHLFTWKMAPALAAGNCVISKPPELTPMTAYLFTKLCVQAGLPAGVLNVLHGRGSEIGAKLVDHKDIKAVSFTGGTQTGKTIAAAAAPMLKKVSFELGGKNPTVVFADADFEKAVAGAIKGAFANQGQVCLCGSRVLVERSIYNKFRDAFVAEAQKIKPADPLAEGTKMGAMISKEHMEKVLGHIEVAEQEGGTILTGGKRAQVGGRCADGYFIEPTVIEGLPNDCRTNQEEIFGPVATLIPFDDEAEAVTLANGVEYGLAASIWTENVHRANRVARAVDAGIIWVNTWNTRDMRTPFGGMKNSGMGREGGWESLRFFTEPKNVCLKY